MSMGSQALLLKNTARPNCLISRGRLMWDKAFISPMLARPFINCRISTLKPCPKARKAKPKAAVVFPLPDPVLINTSPLRFILMSSFFFRHAVTARACIPPRGATLKIGLRSSSYAPTRRRARRGKIRRDLNLFLLILCVLGELCGEEII